MCYNLYNIIITPNLDRLGVYIINITSLAGKASSSHTHNTIYEQDTRNINNNPDWYRYNYDMQIVLEFKTASVIGLNVSVTYVELVTMVPWHDASGGNVVQRAIDYNSLQEYIRSGESTTWSSWKVN